MEDTEPDRHVPRPRRAAWRRRTAPGCRSPRRRRRRAADRSGAWARPAMVCSIDVTAITSWPFSLASRAKPTIEPLTPEFEAITKTSPGWIGDRSQSSRDDRRIPLQPGAAERVQRKAAAEHEVAEGDLVGRDEAAGPAGDLHGERLRVPGAERVDDRPGRDGPGEQVDGLVQPPGRRRLGELIDPAFVPAGRSHPTSRGEGARVRSCGPPRPTSGPEPCRGGRRCEETARADAASLALDRSKLCWATSR